jgi:DNA-binding response OmpR family regulator
METNDRFRAPTVAPFLLVVEPNPNDAELLVRSFRDLGYRTKWSADGFDAIRHFRISKPDMVIINSLLPDMYGSQVLEQIQAERRTLALMVVDTRECDPHTIMDSPGNDFLFKPLHFAEIAFRVSRVFQNAINANLSEPEPALPASHLCRLGPLRIDAIRQLVSHEKHKLELTQTQFRLLEHFARHPGTVFNREQLRSSAHITGTQVNIVDVHIHNLRHQLQAFNLGYLIETVRGLGYRGWQDPMFLEGSHTERGTHDAGQLVASSKRSDTRSGAGTSSELHT